jgi:hypothetical protein
MSKNLNAVALVRLARGVPKHYSKSELKIRTERLRRLADPALAEKRKQKN